MLIHNFEVDFNWLILKKLSQLERFTGQWSGMIMSEGYGLKQLKSMATVSNTGASTRLDGSGMSDEEIEALIDHLDVEKLDGRDQQLAAGYFETLDLISEAWQDVPISEISIKSLHDVLVKYSVNDEHYSPAETTRRLVEWYKKEKEAHPLIRIAVFVYAFLNGTGNGCLSRLLTNLLLLKEGYGWIEYISLDHELELRKSEYNKVLQEQHQLINPWVLFFLDCMVHVQQKLLQKLETRIEDLSISPRVQQIRMYVEHHGGARTGEIAENLGIPLPTVKKEVTAMVASGWLVRHGSGAGTNYTANPRLMSQPGQTILLGKNNSVSTFQLTRPGATRQIKKIVLTPLFNWRQPHEWSDQLHRQGMVLAITCTNRKGISNTNRFALVGFIRSFLFQPLFTFKDPVVIPHSIVGRAVYQYEYPWQVSIQLEASVPVENYLFDVFLIYDAKE